LVFAMGSESVSWLYKNYQGGALPVVTVCSKDPVLLGQIKDYDHGSGSNFAFTSLNVPIEVQMSYVNELRPELKNIAILVDSKNTSAMETQAEPVASYAAKNGIKIIWSTVENPTNAREELAKIVPSAVAQMRSNDPDLSKSLFWITGSTSVFNEIRTINQYSDRVPVVSVVPEIVKAGVDTATLGIGVSFESNGRLAGIYGAQTLAGTKVGSLKVGLVTPPDMAINFLKAREIGLRVPFNFFEIASFVYDYEGKAVRSVKSEAESSN
jgi:putative ABC transport system substrate-binding protein